MALQFWDSLPDDVSIKVLEAPDIGSKTGCVIAFIGSPNSGVVDTAPILAAFDTQNTIAGNVLSVAIPVETGPVNSLAPILVAAARNIAVTDGDGAARAVPELTMLTYSGVVEIAPAILDNGKGVTAIIYPSDTHAAEQLIRPVITEKAFGGFAGFCCWTSSGDTLTKNTLWGTLSGARDLGRAILGGTTATGILKVLNDLRDGPKSYLIGSGVLHVGPSFTQGGFDFGTVALDTGRSTITIFVQNENLTAWDLDSDEPVALAPDCICFWDNTTNRPFTNVEVAQYENKSVSLIGVPPLYALINGFPSALRGYAAGIENLGYAGAPWYGNLSRSHGRQAARLGR